MSQEIRLADRLELILEQIAELKRREAQLKDCMRILCERRGVELARDLIAP